MGVGAGVSLLARGDRNDETSFGRERVIIGRHSGRSLRRWRLESCDRCGDGGQRFSGLHLVITPPDALVGWNRGDRSLKSGRSSGRQWRSNSDPCVVIRSRLGSSPASRWRRHRRTRRLGGDRWDSRSYGVIGNRLFLDHRIESVLRGILAMMVTATMMERSCGFPWAARCGGRAPEIGVAGALDRVLDGAGPEL